MPGTRGTGSFGMFGLSALKIGKYAALFNKRSTSASLYVSGFTPGGNVGGSGNGSGPGEVGSGAVDAEVVADGLRRFAAGSAAAPLAVARFVDPHLLFMTNPSAGTRTHSNIIASAHPTNYFSYHRCFRA